MKIELPPIPKGGGSMLFGVALTDGQADLVLTGLSLYQDELKTELETEFVQEDRGILERMISDIELILLSCPDYVRAMHDQEEPR